MWKDEILEEIYRIREEHAKAFNYDLKAMCEDLRKRQAASGRKIRIISKPLRKSHQTYNYQKLTKYPENFDSSSNEIESSTNFYKEDQQPIIEESSKSNHPPSITTPTQSDEIIYPDLDTVNLTHAKILEGHLGESEIRTWKDLVYQAHRYALEYYDYDIKKLIRLSTKSNIREGDCNENGFSSYFDLGISIQGADANNSWRSALYLAQHIGIEIEVWIEWRQKEKAMYPGKKARLFWNGKH